MQSWSADGHLVSFVPLINRFQVRKDGPKGEVVATATLPGTSATHLFQINGQQYRLTKTAAFVPVIDLERVGAGFVPESLEFHRRVAAPPGATCPEHSVAASVACSRCGKFVCASCVGINLIHCKACFARVEAEGARLPRAAAYTVPGVLFILLGGMLGAIIGLVVGGVAYFVARRIDRPWLRALVAVALYAAAAVALLALQVVMSAKR